MNKDNNIHQFEFNLICEFFLKLKRQGPGGQAETLKALSFIRGLSEKSVIADLGCGTGGQTMTLAQHVEGHITGLDLFPSFIDKFNGNAQQLGLQDRVKGIVGDMCDMPFSPESIDLIWSEGSIYNIGFERGINEWRKYLRQGGYLAVSENTWLTEKRPQEIEDFWQQTYPEIGTVASKVEQMQKAGYMPVATFVLPEECWTTNYYVPAAKAEEEFLAAYPDNETVKTFIGYLRQEEALYRKYGEYYGYVFYIGKKI